MARFIKLDKGRHRDMGKPSFSPVLVAAERIAAVYIKSDGYVGIVSDQGLGEFFVKQSFEEVQALLIDNPEQSTKE